MEFYSLKHPFSQLQQNILHEPLPQQENHPFLSQQIHIVDVTFIKKAANSIPKELNFIFLNTKLSNQII